MLRRTAYLDGDAGCVERLKPAPDCFRPRLTMRRLPERSWTWLIGEWSLNFN